MIHPRARSLQENRLLPSLALWLALCPPSPPSPLLDPQHLCLGTIECEGASPSPGAYFLQHSIHIIY